MHHLSKPPMPKFRIGEFSYTVVITVNWVLKEVRDLCGLFVVECSFLITKYEDCELIVWEVYLLLTAASQTPKEDSATSASCEIIFTRFPQKNQGLVNLS